jgi:glycosyltransferase involved in cell wall biosynthesis
MDVDYSIIIPAYNEEELLPGTLSALRRAMGAVETHRGEVLVTDNDSSDRTAEVARDGGAEVIFEEHRQIARSRNAGGAAARGRFLIFLDADTRITAALLRRTLETLEGGAAGGGTRMSFEPLPERSAHRLAAFWNLISRRLRWACGAYVFCRREAFEAIGGFDERYYASEEIHFSRALKRWGRARGMPVTILDEPIYTSTRKLEWFGTRVLLRSLLRTALHPGRLRSREGCHLWYERPQEKSDVASPNPG